MGTEYVLHEDGDNSLSIYEMSNRFSVGVDNEDDGFAIEMTPEQALKAFIYGVKVCSYWMDERKVAAAVRELAEYLIAE
ncbi:MAG: hypothetical protein M0Z43_02210 [Acidithiobacillus sp.]|nr:hypothetical protein [Acidithiobacillus sp.]